MKRIILLTAVSLLAFQTFVFSQVPAEANAQSVQPETEESLKNEVQIQYSHESLSKNFGTWKTASIFYQRKLKNRRAVWASYQVTRRNEFPDEEISLGTYQPFGNKWAATVEASYSPGNIYLSKYGVRGEIEKGLKRGYLVHFGGKFRSYTGVNATTGFGTLEKYWGNNHAGYTLYLTKLTKAGTAPSHRVQYNRYFGEKVHSFGTAFSIGKEHENLGPNLGILRSSTWSVSLSGKYWITKKVGVNINGLIHQQGDIYTRRGMNFGATYRF